MKKTYLFILLLNLYFLACNPSEKKLNKPNITQIPSENKNKNPAINTDFSEFWKKFRLAILNKQIKEVKKMTQFPLETRGIMDEDQIIKYSETEVENLFTIILAEDDGTGKNRSVGEHLKAFTRTQASADDRELSLLGEEVRFDNLVFRNIEGKGWQLAFVYLNDESYEKLGRKIER